MIDRRRFVQSSALAGAAVLMSKNVISVSAADIDLENATVASLQSAMSSGQATAKSIAQG